MLRSMLTIFFRTPNTHPWAVLLCLLASSLAGGLSLASLLPLFSLIIDAGEENDSAVAQTVRELLDVVGLDLSVGSLLAVFVVGTVARSLLKLLAMTFVGNTTANVATDLRRDLVGNLMSVRWGYLTNQPLGRLANSASTEATRAAKAYFASASFLANTLQAVIFIGIAFFVSWKLSVVALGTGLAIAGALHVFVLMIRRAGVRQTRRTSELVTYLSDALNSIKPLKAMARQDGFSRLFERKIDGLRKALRLQVVSREGRRAFDQILNTCCLALIFYAAITLWSYPISEVAVMGVLLSQTVKHIGKVQDYLQQAVVLEAPYRAIRGLIDEAERESEDLGGRATPRLDEGVSLCGVDFDFEGKRVLEGVDLDIPVGEITVLTGPSGSGKTTITDLILGLFDTDGGDVRVDGVPLRELDKLAWRGMIGYVPQELILFHDTVFANIALGDPAITEADAAHALQVAGAWDFVSAQPDGMMTVVGEKGVKQSGGQRQRIALARALVIKPRLLILDEVTSALDPETENDLCQRLKSLTPDMGILAITHRPAFFGIADRIYRVEEAAITEVVQPPPASLARPA